MPTFSVQTATPESDAWYSSGVDFWDYYVEEQFLGNVTTADYGVWMHFANITIPQGAIISAARLLLVAYNWDGTSVLSKIQVEQADNPTMPANLLDAVGRTLSTKVDWDFNPQTLAAPGVAVGTVDFASLIQAIVDRAGWASGNAINISLYDDGSESNNYWAVMGLVNEFGTQQPTLEITYSVSVAAPPPLCLKIGLGL